MCDFICNTDGMLCIQVVVDAIDPSCLVSACASRQYDFLEMHEQELHNIVLPLDLEIGMKGIPCFRHHAHWMSICSTALISSAKARAQKLHQEGSASFHAVAQKCTQQGFVLECCIAQAASYLPIEVPAVGRAHGNDALRYLLHEHFEQAAFSFPCANSASNLLDACCPSASFPMSHDDVLSCRPSNFHQCSSHLTCPSRRLLAFCDNWG